MQLKQALQAVQQVLQPEIEQVFKDYQPRVNPIDPWAVQVLARLQEYCQRPGKGVRPLLVAMGAALAQQIPLAEAWQQPDVRRAMVITQLKHKRILMVDDMSDQDEMRNGKPSFHVLWEHDLAQQAAYQAISQEKRRHLARSYTEVAGMWLDSISFWLLRDSAFSDQQRVELLEIMQEHVYDKTPAGWYIIFDQSVEPLTAQTSEARLIHGLELVSGEYTFISPLRMGASLQKAENAFALDATLRYYGEPAGILFQITDDIIGAFGDPAVTGKPVGGDFREGKKTVLVQHAYRQGTPKQQQFLQSMIGKETLSETEVAKVQKLIRQTGALEYAQQAAQQYADQALAALEDLPDSAEKRLLAEIITFLLHRQK